MGTLRDDELWSCAARGDHDAFGTLFERHAEAIYNYCFRRTADWALAEDLTSIVFLEAWRRRRTVRIEQASALPWLYGVATNVLRNARRSLRRHAAALERVPPPPLTIDDVDEIAGRLDDERHMRPILRAVADLPRRELEVLALVAWCDLTYADAARALQIPIGTVRSRLARARARVHGSDSADPLHRTEGALTHE